MARTLLTAAAALALCVLSSGCGRRSAAPDEPATVVASAQAPEAAPNTSSEPSPQAPPKDETARIRRAIRDFIAEKYPSSEVEGVWMLNPRGNYCFAGADTVINSRHRTIDVLVRQFVREDGSEYWRGEGPELETRRLLQPDSGALSPSSDN